METLAQRLRYCRERAKLSQSELARRVGIKPQAIQYIESGKVYKPRNILEIAEVVGVDAHWLSSGKGAMAGHAKLTLTSKTPVQVPLRSWQQTAAHCEEVESWIPTTAEVSERAYALKVKSDSMEPEFAPGDFIVADPERHYRHGSYVIAHLANQSELILRELAIDGGRHYLKPLNPRYQIETCGENDRICATVVFKGKAYLDNW